MNQACFRCVSSSAYLKMRLAINSTCYRLAPPSQSTFAYVFRTVIRAEPWSFEECVLDLVSGTKSIKVQQGMFVNLSLKAIRTLGSFHSQQHRSPRTTRHSCFRRLCSNMHATYVSFLAGSRIWRSKSYFRPIPAGKSYWSSYFSVAARSWLTSQTKLLIKD